jgi:hypothetical protein
MGRREYCAKKEGDRIKERGVKEGEDPGGGNPNESLHKLPLLLPPTHTKIFPPTTVNTTN